MPCALEGYAAANLDGAAIHLTTAATAAKASAEAVAVEAAAAVGTLVESSQEEPLMIYSSIVTRVHV